MDEQFPDGFDCDGCYLNGVSTWAGDNTELFSDSEHPGVDATVMAVEGITGLEINYWAMVNLEGFKDLVDAVGGVTLNVRDRSRSGCRHDVLLRYIEPGDAASSTGCETLWFARARVRLRRLLADGAAEVRHERDAAAGQPAGRRCATSASIAEGQLRDGLHEHPGQRGRPLHRAGAEGQGAEDLDAVAGAAAGQHRRPRHRRWSRTRSPRRSTGPRARAHRAGEGQARSGRSSSRPGPPAARSAASPRGTPPTSPTDLGAAC